MPFEHWLIYFFQTPSNESSKLSDGSLMAKMLYHTQLLRMGLERVIMEGGRAVVFYVVVLIAAFFFSSSSFFWMAMGFPVICVMTYVAMLIGKHYISQEQTLNTKFVKVLFHQMNNLSQVQSLGLEQDRFHQLNQIIEQDTHFRKRREMWLKFSDRLVFAIILLAGGMLYLIKDFYPILHWNNWSEGAIGIVLTGYFAKILMQSVHAGIFWQALKTGLLISVPEFKVGPNPFGKRSKVNFLSSLTIQGKKAKLSKFGSPIKQFRLVLEPGSKTLIVGEGTVGKTTLAKYLCGMEKIDSLNVKNDGNFLLSHIWCGHNRDRQLISLTPVFRETVAEFLLAQPAEDLDLADLNNIFKKLKKYPEFNFIFQFKEFLGKRFDSLQGSLTELALLQIAQSILRQPKLICVDNSVFDLPNPLVQKSLLILAQECAASTIVYFTVDPKNAKNFKKTYNLSLTDFTPQAKDA